MNRPEQLDPDLVDYDAPYSSLEITSGAPYRFAIHGRRRRDGESYVDYGVDFRDARGAFYLISDEGSTCQFRSAESITELLNRIGDARLRWIDVPDNNPHP